MNNVTFNKGQGGLQRVLPGQDYISGLLFFSDTYPSGFSASAKVKQIFSPAQAEALGIDSSFSDETPAEAEYQITAIGSNGDTLQLIVDEPGANGAVTEVDLGTYTKSASETDADGVAAAVAAVINAGTVDHGYSATSSTDTVTIVAKAGTGVSLNSGTPLSATIVGTIAGTITQFTGGVASLVAPMKYHIDRFFAMSPNSELWVGVFPVPATYNFTEVQDMQIASSGVIRQIGVYNTEARTTTQLANDGTALQTIKLALDALHMPLSILYGANIEAVADISTVVNLATYNNYGVSIDISQDGKAAGGYLFATSGVSITNIGALLGTVSAASVSESIAYVEAFNVSDGTENESPAFANGQLISSLPEAALTSLDNKRYLFLRKFVGVSGSFWNDSHTASSPASDYAYIENNRTIDKAIRNLYTKLVLKLSSPIQLNSDGTISNDTIDILLSTANPDLNQMVRDAELSAFLITIDPAQNVLSTSELEVGVQLVGIGVARRITVNIGYVLSV